MASIGAMFTTTYLTKQLNQWPNSSSSCVVNYSRLSAFQGDMEPFEGDPSTCKCLTSHNKSNLVDFQHQYLSTLLVIVYSYHLMVKVCLTVVSMKASFSQVGSHLLVYASNYPMVENIVAMVENFDKNI